MTCELFNGPCDECEETCETDRARIRQEHFDLQSAIKLCEANLEVAKANLACANSEAEVFRTCMVASGHWWIIKEK